MRGGRLRQLENRRRRFHREVLQALHAESEGTPEAFHVKLVGLLGAVLGELGQGDRAAAVLRRAFDLANATGEDDKVKLRLLRMHDDLAKRPPMLYRARARGLDIDGAIEAVRSVVDLPTLPTPDRAWLEQMDEARYERPRRTLALLLPEHDRVSDELMPLYLGITGSTYRMRAGQKVEIEADLKRAEEMVKAGLEIAEDSGEGATIADLLQRLAYIVGDRGRHKEALELVERAGGLYDRLGDRAGRGKALVDQGMFLGHLNRPADAIIAEEMALEILPAEETRNRTAALQVIGVSSLRLNRPRAALQSLNDAIAVGMLPDRASEARLIWLHASAYSLLREYKLAADKYQAAVEILRTIHYADTALVTVELVRVLILSGRHKEAYETALSVRDLILPLRKNRHVSAALIELLRGGQEALTLRRVEQVSTALEQARAKRYWRTLKVSK